MLTKFILKKVLIRYDEMEEVDKEFLMNALPTIEQFKAYIESKIK